MVLMGVAMVSMRLGRVRVAEYFGYFRNLGA